MMSPKERIDAVLAGKPTDKTPFCFVDGGAWISKTENLTYRMLYGLPDGGAEKIVKWTDEFETDIVSAVSANTFFTKEVKIWQYSIIKGIMLK